MKGSIIISEKNRPFWQLPIAALFFTASFAMLFISLYILNWSFDAFIDMVYGLEFTVLLSLIGIGFCSQKRIYIDLEKSRFKPTLEIGFIKIGKWTTIYDYEYVSVFYDPSKGESNQFEVNLWYDRNKHFELYSRNNFEDAMSVGYDLSEQLNIDLLDATVRNDQKWIDKEALKANTK